MTALMAEQQPKFLKMSEAADVLRCSRAKLYALHKRGEIDLIKFGRITLVPQASLDSLLSRLKYLERKPEGEA